MNKCLYSPGKLVSGQMFRLSSEALIIAHVQYNIDAMSRSPSLWYKFACYVVHSAAHLLFCWLSPVHFFFLMHSSYYRLVSIHRSVAVRDSNQSNTLMEKCIVSFLMCPLFVCLQTVHLCAIQCLNFLVDDMASLCSCSMHWSLTKDTCIVMGLLTLQMKVVCWFDHRLQENYSKFEQLEALANIVRFAWSCVNFCDCRSSILEGLIRVLGAPGDLLWCQ